MDNIDLAQEREEGFRKAALAAFRDHHSGQGESAYFCRVCGIRIPDDRRQAVKTDLCIDCARQIDKGGR
jgi:phage/conjugal plasmid C-4 type zinc finger TraR family protein